MSEHAADIRALAEALAKGLTESPSEVSVETVEDDSREIVLELVVAETDMGRVIGKGGRTVRALRNVLSAAAGKQGKHLELDLVE